MRLRHILVLVISGWLFTPSLVKAGPITGTVQSIDASRGQLILMRSGKTVMVSVRDPQELGALKAGKQVTLEAGKIPFGGWVAE